MVDIKIQLSSVHKRFGNKIVLDGLSLSVPKGKSVAVIGGSGTGKSVMLKSVLGIVTPDAGHIQVDGRETTNMSPKQREIVMHKFGMLFQNAALFDSLPVWENVAFGLVQAHRVKRKQAREIAIHTLARVGLGADVGDLYPAELSGGMQKRVGLARAIATTPEVIFFDEPTTGLDPIMADIINDLIVEQVEELGATTLSITHDMVSARKIADFIAMIYRGKIIWFGPVEDVNHSGNEYVDQFIHGRADGPIRMEVRHH